MDTILKAINELMYGEESWYGNKEKQRLLERIRWYVDNWHEVLVQHNQFFVEINIEN